MTFLNLSKINLKYRHVLRNVSTEMFTISWLHKTNKWNVYYRWYNDDTDIKKKVFIQERNEKDINFKCRIFKDIPNWLCE